MARNNWVKLPDGSYGVSVFGSSKGTGDQVRLPDGEDYKGIELGELLSVSGNTKVYAASGGPSGAGDEAGEGKGENGSGEGEESPAPGNPGGGEEGKDEDEGEGEGDEGDGEDEEGEGEDEEGEQPEQTSSENEQPELGDFSPLSQPDAPEPFKVDPEQQELDRFWSEWNRLRDLIANEHRTTGEQIDQLESMRPVQEAARMIAYGTSADTMLHAMVMHWPEEAKRRLSAEYRPDLKIGRTPDGMHACTNYVLRLAAARIPILLTGPAGVGKSHLTESVATALELGFDDCSVCAGATPSWLLGRHTINPDAPYISAGFVDTYSNGGVFAAEEFDSGDANMLLVINKAIANGRFTNPVTGEQLVKHENFVPIACANTFGLGANSLYTGRERLDFATIDRFRMGRVLVELDLALARRLMDSNFTTTREAIEAA